MSNPTIISCAVTGNITNIKQYPNLPCSPEQVANACISAAHSAMVPAKNEPSAAVARADPARPCLAIW